MLIYGVPAAVKWAKESCRRALSWPIKTRYSFPEGLVVPVMIVILYIIYCRIIFVSWDLRKRNSRRMKRMRQPHKISISERQDNNLTVKALSSLTSEKTDTTEAKLFRM